MSDNNNSRLMEMLSSSKGKVKIKEERVLNYLLEHEDEIQNLSIAQISEAADVSKATVVRFCKSLDFNGLKDFKVWYEAGKGARYVEVSPVGKDDDGEKILSGLSAGISRGLERTLGKDNLDMLNTMVDDIKTSNVIIISGEGEADSFARLFAVTIGKYYPEKKIFLNPKEEVNGDLCLAVSVTGREKSTMEAVSRVVFDGGKADVISLCPSSLISKAATNAIIVSDEEFFKGDPHLLGKFSILAAVEFLCIMIGKGQE